MVFGKVGSVLSAARLRAMFTRTEVAGFTVVAASALCGVMAVALGQWKTAAGLAAAAVAIAAFLALFSARRSRLAAERVVSRVDTQGRQLLAKLQEGRLAPVPLSWSDGSGRREGGNPAFAASMQLIAADDLDAYTRLADTMPDHRWLDNTILRNARKAAIATAAAANPAAVFH